jgi:hypothetical protein
MFEVLLSLSTSFGKCRVEGRRKRKKKKKNDDMRKIYELRWEKFVAPVKLG